MTEITRGSGNVFADMEMLDADELQAKAELGLLIHREIQAKGLNLDQAAARIGATSSTLSKLLAGQLRLVGLEDLRAWAARIKSD